MGQVFRVNSYQDNWQQDPDVIALQDGGFLIVYESYLNDYDSDVAATVILAQRYDASGRPIGGETMIDGRQWRKLAQCECHASVRWRLCHHLALR